MSDPEIIDVISGKRLTRFELFDRGDLVMFPFLRPCRLKILMVVDDNISFSHAYFGLSHVLDVLRNNPEFYVKFDVTRAHREVDPFKPNQAADPVAWGRYGPHFENFRFDQGGFNIDDYDQVWLFGFHGEGHSTTLTAAELEVLSRWMDRGGGLFATGDHADLGAAMCSQVPRARSMRRWTAAQGVPPATSPARHDTLLKGGNPDYTFDDESDDQPMRITPKYYGLGSWSPFIRRQAPHPVLCGQDGVIDILPDHPHEGEIIDESLINLAQTFSFGTYINRPEYPASGGVQPGPEVVAWARVQSDHPAGGFKGLANAKSFGAIGAYNGHQGGVGRVVVDSTWHHWFDVNLIGRPVGFLDSTPMNGTNPKTQGFFASPAGMNALARIDNYFRNVALWLAPKSKQNCMFMRATWGIVLRYPLVERLHPKLPIWELGGTAYDAIGRRARQCVVTSWIYDLFPRELFEVFLERLKPRPDPCLTCPPFELIERYVLGGITREMLALAYELDNGETKEGREIDEYLVLKSFFNGARAGVDELLAQYRDSIERSQKLLGELPQLLSIVPSPDDFLPKAGEEPKHDDRRQAATEDQATASGAEQPPADDQA